MAGKGNIFCWNKNAPSTHRLSLDNCTLKGCSNHWKKIERETFQSSAEKKAIMRDWKYTVLCIQIFYSNVEGEFRGKFVE